jgi:hypothetical protein
VNNGVVLLSGKTNTLVEKLRAIELAYNVGGVSRVASEIAGWKRRGFGSPLGFPGANEGSHRAFTGGALLASGRQGGSKAGGDLGFVLAAEPTWLYAVGAFALAHGEAE